MLTKQALKESTIQKRVVDYAVSQGWRFHRFIDKGMPDRIFFGFGKVFLIEFKHPKGKLRPLQAFTISELRNAGIEVFVVDDIEQGKRIVDEQTP